MKPLKANAQSSPHPRQRGFFALQTNWQPTLRSMAAMLSRDHREDNAANDIGERDAKRNAANSDNTKAADAHQLPSLHLVGDLPHFRDILLNSGDIALDLADTIDKQIHALVHRCAAGIRFYFRGPEGVSEIANLRQQLAKLLMGSGIEFNWRH
jgi:hypothetical protein